MSTFLLKHSETVEVTTSQVEHVQGTYNGWTLAVDSVEIRFHDAANGPRPDQGIKITLNCARVNKLGKRGAQRIGEDFWGSANRAKPTPVPRWVIPILLDHKPAWFTGRVSDMFEGTDRTTVETSSGVKLLTWRAPR